MKPTKKSVSSQKAKIWKTEKIETTKIHFVLELIQCRDVINVIAAMVLRWLKNVHHFNKRQSQLHGVAHFSDYVWIKKKFAVTFAWRSVSKIGRTERGWFSVTINVAHGWMNGRCKAKTHELERRGKFGAGKRIFRVMRPVLALSFDHNFIQSRAASIYISRCLYAICSTYVQTDTSVFMCLPVLSYIDETQYADALVPRGARRCVG